MRRILGKNGLLSQIAGRLPERGEREDDRGENATFSIMTPRMITPVDKPVSVSRAVQIYQKYMLSAGYLEKDDITDFIRSLKEDMAEHEDELKYAVKNAKEQVAEAKGEVKRLKKTLARCKDDDDREYAQEELDTATADFDEESICYEKLVTELSLFKKDKREFLLNYINREIHGDDWQETREIRSDSGNTSPR